MLRNGKKITIALSVESVCTGEATPVGTDSGWEHSALLQVCVPSGSLSWVGRTAMTCYILQNLIASLIFYDVGLGVAGRMPEAWHLWGTLAIYLGISALLIVGAGIWLRFFSRGPFELVMHRAHDWLVAHVHRPLAARRAARPAADQPTGSASSKVEVSMTNRKSTSPSTTRS
ncbi:DUF418 domain-containing protein [Ornithinimicrobium sp. Y1847]|uniref:DUF418 domain-containing protein n=2 Tax=Ornithinimicrobium TaxID=125287 RepID=UPI003B67C19E